MLTQFKVKGFKNFRDELVFNLDNVRDYEFNSNAVYPGKAVKTGLIYGINGSGKSNLGYAIFDIIHHLTDKMRGNNESYFPYKNLDTDLDATAQFSYTFNIHGKSVNYTYEKELRDIVIKETVTINNIEVMKYDRHSANLPYLHLQGAESLNISSFDKKMSFVKFVKSNTQLDDNETNRAFNGFVNFVENMLFFTSIPFNHYMGFESVKTFILDYIIESQKLEDLQKFLQKNNLNYKLQGVKSENAERKWRLNCVFDKASADIASIASSGTNALILLFYWLNRMQCTEKPSFVFIDEFDAFYHADTARIVIEHLKDLDIQVLLTTHNQTIMDNDLLRPDCYFTLENGKITPFSDLTEKDIRQAHNLQKMYRGGMFRGKQ